MKLPRGLCERCGRDVPIRRNGFLREHNDVSGRLCSGERPSWQPKHRLIVGDVVTVAKASGVNAAHARAVIVERYELAGRDGWMLLFEDGRHDGFSPDDCVLFGVVKIRHAPSVADYHFANVTRLTADWRAGRFAEAFRP